MDTYWTSLEDNPYEVILLYHDHRTCEQFHSEIKTDMDMERLASEHFFTNSDIIKLPGLSVPPETKKAMTGIVRYVSL